jgi:superfamily II DNA/RNA helicase
MTQPTHIRAMGDETENAHTVKAIEQFVYRAHAMDKVELISRVLQARGRGLCLIFTRTKRTAAKVAEDLEGRGFAAAAIHGDLGQGAREQALRAFRNGKIDVLVATDVAARGIDVENVTHVINYACPEDEKIYVHRIGRTARAGNTGIAITLVDWEDLPRWSLIDRQLDLGIPEPEETYSSSEHLYAELDIPTDAKGFLGSEQQTRAGLDAEEIEDLGETGGRRRGGSGGAGRGGRDRDDRGRGERSGRGGKGRDRDEPDGDRRARGARPNRQDDGASSATNESSDRGPGGPRPRQRRRTRGGAATQDGLDSGAESGPQSQVESGASAQTPDTASGTADASDGRPTGSGGPGESIDPPRGGDARRLRRRRRRPGSGAGALPDAGGAEGSVEG